MLLDVLAAIRRRRGRSIDEAMDSAFFSDLLASIAERERSELKRTPWPRYAREVAHHALADRCGALLTGRGEASGLALAGRSSRATAASRRHRRPRFSSARRRIRAGPVPEQDAVTRSGAKGDEASASG